MVAMMSRFIADSIAAVASAHEMLVARRTNDVFPPNFLFAHSVVPG
jgi:hypothetical protein